MRNPSWNFFARFRFYLTYGFAKLGILWNVQKPKWRFFLFELRYSLTKLRNIFVSRKIPLVLYRGPVHIKTRRGSFQVRPNSHDATIISPAYERRDVNYLIYLFTRLLHTSKAVGFIDIGANIGSFTIPMALKFHRRGLRSWAIEPIPGNIKMLRANLALNSLAADAVQVLPLALSDHDGEISMRFSPLQGGDATANVESRLPGEIIKVKTCRGDTVLTDLPPYLVIKIDVEGHEPAVLNGLVETIKKTKVCWICIEDGNRNHVFAQLKDLGFSFATKLTPYNSWWSRV